MDEKRNKNQENGEFIQLLKTLSSAFGPSGDEGGICRCIQELARPFADEVTVDTLGNLIVHRKGPGPRVMLCAHMDSIGFIITHIEKEGFLRCGRLGGVAPREAVYTAVRFKNGVQGTFVKEEEADYGKLKLDECYIDIGAKSAEEAGAMVQLGDTAVYDSPFLRTGSRVIAPYMDNRISCAVLLRVLQRAERKNDCYYVFTAQEEVGLRGARTAAYQIDPSYAAVVDVTDVCDTPGSEKCGTVQLGKGAAVKVMDRSVICHPRMVELLTGLARRDGIEVQRDIMTGGGTDAGAIHTTRLGVITGGVSVPCRYVHTPTEMADLSDTDACIRLLTALAGAELEEV